MELYQRLVEIFELSTINIDKANRRTLLRYAKRTEFQKRREIFYSICDEGTKSKVAICKTDERPQWVKNLDTLKTKALRTQLKTFLKVLGIMDDPKTSNLKKIAKRKNWEAVVKLQDETKTGGTGALGNVGTPVRPHAPAMQPRTAPGAPLRRRARRSRSRSARPIESDDEDGFGSDRSLSPHIEASML